MVAERCRVLRRRKRPLVCLACNIVLVSQLVLLSLVNLSCSGQFSRLKTSKLLMLIAMLEALGLIARLTTGLES